MARERPMCDGSSGDRTKPGARGDGRSARDPTGLASQGNRLGQRCKQAGKDLDRILLAWGSFDQRFRVTYAIPAPPSFTSMTRHVTRKRIATASGRATSVRRGICVIAEATGADWMLVGSTAAVATSFDTGAPNALWK